MGEKKKEVMLVLVRYRPLFRFVSLGRPVPVDLFGCRGVVVVVVVAVASVLVMVVEMVCKGGAIRKEMWLYGDDVQIHVRVYLH